MRPDLVAGSSVDVWPDRCRFCLERPGPEGYLLLRLTPICDTCLDSAALALGVDAATSPTHRVAR